MELIMSYKIRFNCLKFSSTCLFLLFFQVFFAQKTLKTIGIERFSDFDQLLMANKKALGENFVTLIWTDTLVYRREAGDFTATTLGPILSSSKWLTTALVLVLVDEGKISLDDKVSRYIPLFETYNKNYITIRQCLSHLTGIASETPGILKLIERKKYNSLEEAVNSFAKKEIRNNPGTDFYYSNIGLDIAGRICEIVSKKKFDVLIRSKLLVPLAMRQTTFSTLDGSAVNPSDGAQSNANEYLHFLEMILNKGLYKGKRILSEASVKALRSTQTIPTQIKYTPLANPGFGYALGSFVIDQDGQGQATSLVCPGLFGMWPVIDFCRGYACIFFSKRLLADQKTDLYLKITASLAEKLPSKCN